MSEGYVWDVFVSYSHADHNIVRALADELRTLGLRVWLDEDSVSVGESITGAIEKGISGSRSMIVCFSSHYASSEWAQMELAAAQYADPSNKARSFIPISLDGHPLPRTLAPLLHLNLLNPAMVPDVARRIADSLLDNSTDGMPEGKAPALPPGELPEASVGTSLAARWDAVLLIAALNKESEALRRLLAFSSARRTQSTHRDRPYEMYLFPGGQRLVLVTLGSSGRLSAALTTREFMDLLPFKATFLVGICGALSQSLRIGDIVISDQVVDYEAGKITPDGTERRWRAFRSSFALTSALNAFRGDGWRWLIREMLPSKEEPRAQIGTVLSGDKVIASVAARKELTSAWPSALGVEMEAAGIASMLSQQEDSPAFVMVKSVCDLADESKNDDFQKAAATAAAAFVIEFLLESWAATD